MDSTPGPEPLRFQLRQQHAGFLDPRVAENLDRQDESDVSLPEWFEGRVIVYAPRRFKLPEDGQRVADLFKAKSRRGQSPRLPKPAFQTEGEMLLGRGIISESCQEFFRRARR